jgi:PiT family inorganic phosphate transporter
VIASRAMHPRLALYLTAVAEFAAPFLFGVAVARNVATGLVDAKAITLNTLVVAILAALIWTLIAWRTGVPSSSTHALIGGMLGAALFIDGPRAIVASGLVRVVLPLFIAPPVGILVSFLTMALLLALLRHASPRVNNVFRRLQVLMMVGLALAHSANDAQKSMGVIALGLVLAGEITAFHVPPGVVLACAAAIAVGASRGDWRLIRTLGGRIYRIRPLNALASQVASAGIILSAALAGAPVSTSQVISMALMGAGAAERVNKVRWQVGVEMLTTWALTIPATMAISALLYWGMGELFKLQWMLAHIIEWLAQSHL